MKLHIQHLHHESSPSFAALVRGQLDALGTTLQIDEARVLVERRLEASPAFRLAAHLVTPGPDIQAEAVDHTLRAALRKLVAELSERIRGRQAKCARRLRSNLQQPAIWRGAAGNRP